MHSLEPIFITRRMLPRRWGRTDLGAWCAEALKPAMAVGEVWVLHPGNVTADGAHFGAHLSETPQEMLGELGRAPPSLRLVATSALTDPLFADTGVTYWRVLEADPRATIEASIDGRMGRRLRCKPGDAFRVSEDAGVKFSAGVVALEARAGFLPRNRAEKKPPLMRVEREPKQARATLMRDFALSVERWRLPAASRLEPNGETCHVLMALTPGVAVDNKPLGKGEAVFIPACGRRVDVFGAGAEVLAAYPDMVPTSIWRHAPEPDPSAAALSRPAPAQGATMFDQGGVGPPGFAAAA